MTAKQKTHAPIKSKIITRTNTDSLIGLLKTLLDLESGFCWTYIIYGGSRELCSRSVTIKFKDGRKRVHTAILQHLKTRLENDETQKC
jgi:hypothetical protein